jgi:hypothetical protein
MNRVALYAVNMGTDKQPLNDNADLRDALRSINATREDESGTTDSTADDTDSSTSDK